REGDLVVLECAIFNLDLLIVAARHRAGELLAVCLQLQSHIASLVVECERPLPGPGRIGGIGRPNKAGKSREQDCRNQSDAFHGNSPEEDRVTAIVVCHRGKPPYRSLARRDGTYRSRWIWGFITKYARRERRETMAARMRSRATTARRRRLSPGLL